MIIVFCLEGGLFLLLFDSIFEFFDVKEYNFKFGNFFIVILNVYFFGSKVDLDFFCVDFWKGKGFDFDKFNLEFKKGVDFVVDLNGGRKV